MFVLLISVPCITCLLRRVYYLPASDRQRTATKVRSAFRLILLMIARCLHSPTKYFSGYRIKRTEIVGACGTYGEEARCIEGFGGEIRG
jgi:hypothetical protein